MRKRLACARALLHFSFHALLFSSALVFLSAASCAGANPQLSATKSEIHPSPTPAASESTVQNLETYCEAVFSQLPGPFQNEKLTQICSEMKALAECESINSAPIFHFEKHGSDKSIPTHRLKRVLAISLIHGDEKPSGSVTRAWIERLQQIDARNTWRVIPIVNPDGFQANTRYNKAGVDLNRNFPSLDWDKNAMTYWEKATKKDKRRYPGPGPASEPETKCIVKHIADFKPDFIISVHTPLGVLDFDGPKIQNPGFKPLPWVGLGNFSGSLGRYMWVDNKTPVLTIELKGNTGLKKLEEFDQLQDISGTVAIQASKLLSAGDHAPIKRSVR